MLGLARTARKLLGLDLAPAPMVGPPTRGERYLIAIIALGLLFVVGSSARGWRALVEVERLKETCDDSGNCWRTIYVGLFDTRLRVSASTGVRVGDIVEVAVSCSGDQCDMKVVGVTRPQSQGGP